MRTDQIHCQADIGSCPLYNVSLSVDIQVSLGCPSEVVSQSRLPGHHFHLRSDLQLRCSGCSAHMVCRPAINHLGSRYSHIPQPVFPILLLRAPHTPHLLIMYLADVSSRSDRCPAQSKCPFPYESPLLLSPAPRLSSNSARRRSSCASALRHDS